MDRADPEISALAESSGAAQMSPSGMGRRAKSRTRWPIERLTHERNVALGSALALSTHSTYNSAIQSWLSFAKRHEFAIEPTVETLSFWIVYESFHIEPRSVNSYLSGVINKLEPFFPDVRSLRNHTTVKRTLRGCMRLYSNPVHRKRPLLLEDIKTISAMLRTSNNFDDKLFLAIVKVGFFSLQRLGELTQPDNVKLRDYRRLPQRITVRRFQDRIEYLLPIHKADILFEGNKIVVEKVQDAWDPVSAFSRYLSARDARFRYQPQLWLTSDGNPPTRSWVLTRLQGLLGSSIAGHSIRSGGATFLALKGVPDERIQAIGRWSSEAWKQYVRKHPVTLQAIIWGRPTFQVQHL
jgi:hypothetical protein